MLTMPPADRAVLSRREEIIAALRQIVPGEGVITAEEERRAYESDGLTAYRQLPMIVALPSTTDQVSHVLRYCQEHNVKVVPRGAGTSLSGGAFRWKTACCSALGSSIASWTSISQTGAWWRNQV